MRVAGVIPVVDTLGAETLLGAGDGSLEFLRCIVEVALFDSELPHLEGEWHNRADHVLSVDLLVALDGSIRDDHAVFVDEISLAET